MLVVVAVGWHGITSGGSKGKVVATVEPAAEIRGGDGVALVVLTGEDGWCRRNHHNWHWQGQW